MNLKFWDKPEIKPALFELHRKFDKSGVSGTGHVLDGVVFPGGATVVCWKSENPSITVFNSFRHFESVHLSRHGKSEVTWIDGFDGADFTLRYFKRIIKKFHTDKTPLFQYIQSKALEIEKVTNDAKKITVKYDRSGKNTLLRVKASPINPTQSPQDHDSSPEKET